MLLFPAPSGSAAATTGTPASSPHRSYGRSRRASTRRSSTGCQPRISSSSRPGRETDLAVALKVQPRAARGFGYRWFGCDIDNILIVLQPIAIFDKADEIVAP